MPNHNEIKAFLERQYRSSQESYNECLRRPESIENSLLYHGRVVALREAITHYSTLCRTCFPDD